MDLLTTFKERGIRVYKLTSDNRIPSKCFCERQDFIDYAILHKIEEVFYYDVEYEDDRSDVPSFYDILQRINHNYLFMQVINDVDLEEELEIRYDQLVKELYDSNEILKSKVFMYYTDIGSFGYIDGDEVQQDQNVNQYVLVSKFFQKYEYLVLKAGNDKALEMNEHFDSLCSMLANDPEFAQIKAQTKLNTYADRFAEKKQMSEMLNIFANINMFKKCTTRLYDKRTRDWKIMDAWETAKQNLK